MKKVLRVVGVVAVFGLIFVAIVTSNVKSADIEEKVWTAEMTLGDLETATRHYIVYTDLMCPYCNYYARAVQENDEDFQKFLAENKVAYEVRVTDMLYEGSGVEYSRPAAEGAYCAAREGKFWEFYHKALDHIFTDYYEKGIGYSKTAPMITDMTRDYWLEIGKEAELSEKFEACYTGREAVAEIQEKTIKASATADGLPYFKFGKFATGGFDPSWDWATIKSMLGQGLK